MLKPRLLGLFERKPELLGSPHTFDDPLVAVGGVGPGTGDGLLMESGDFLLLESGDFILLE